MAKKEAPFKTGELNCGMSQKKYTRGEDGSVTCSNGNVAKCKKAGNKECPKVRK